MPCRYAGITCCRRCYCSKVPTSSYSFLAYSFIQKQICIEKIFEKISKEGITVSSYCFLNSIKNILPYTLRIILCFYNKECYTTYEDCFLYPFGSIYFKKSRNFSSSH